MSKFQPPSIEDVRSYPLNPEITRYLERYRAHRALPREAVRTLDWGCGRGEAVAKLLDAGYDAMGADISEEALGYGMQYFRNIGDPQAAQRLHLIDSQSRLQSAQSASFDYIFSQTVLEHVEHLDHVATELFRLLKPGGVCFHAFPAHRHVVEDHTGMPFLHWFPKNRSREWVIRFWMRFGREPRWVEEDHEARVRRVYKYINTSTFYRPPAELRRVFEAAGFRVAFVSRDHPKLRQHALVGPLMRLPALRGLLGRMALTFTVAELQLTKPDAERLETT